MKHQRNFLGILNHIELFSLYFFFLIFKEFENQCLIKFKYAGDLVKATLGARTSMFSSRHLPGKMMIMMIQSTVGTTHILLIPILRELDSCELISNACIVL